MPDITKRHPAGPPPVPPHLLNKSRGPRKNGKADDSFLTGTVGLAAFVVCIMFSFLEGNALTPIKARPQVSKESVAVQTVRKIGLAMNAYALDHKGAYPAGTTSTEVFQKLVDGKYVTDPEIFYLEMPGKSKAASKKLTANNVCFDTTSGVTVDSSDQLPVVYCTGYAVTYFPGDSAIRNMAGSTPFPGATGSALGGLAVSYKDCSSQFVNADTDGVAHFFIPDRCDSMGKPYMQLTP